MKPLAADRTHKKYLTKKKKRAATAKQRTSEPLTPGRAATVRPATRGVSAGTRRKDPRKAFPVELPSAGHNVLYKTTVGGPVTSNVASVHRGMNTKPRGKYSWILDTDENAKQPQMKNYFVAPSNAGFSDAERRRMRIQTERAKILSKQLKEEVQALCKETVQLRTVGGERGTTLALA